MQAAKPDGSGDASRGLRTRKHEAEYPHRSCQSFGITTIIANSGCWTANVCHGIHVRVGEVMSCGDKSRVGRMDGTEFGHTIIGVTGATRGARCRNHKFDDQKDCIEY